jgi:molybdenum cofactor biosynthesis protein B
MTQSADRHRAAAAHRVAACAVLSVSDSRTRETDRGGGSIIDLLEAAGHSVVAYELARDEAQEIEHQLRAWIADPSIQVILTTGGTGFSRRDSTIQVVQRLLDRSLDGFGELFRALSWRQVGAAAMLSGAVAGLAGETLIFSMPGSPNAVALAMGELILPELRHLIWERSR